MGEVKRLAVFGSRSLDGSEIVNIIIAAIAKHKPQCLVTAAQATGVCACARTAAKETATPLKIYWLERRFGRGKYHNRTVAVLNDCDHCLFIHDGVSTGTSGEIEVAKKLHVPMSYLRIDPAAFLKVQPALRTWTK